ncbi:MAG TPA: hypothetical protein VHO84_13860 [Syntrophorhabdaceae bacterium]|nr:hypothetical protein [Syntrophorhabdaceae bacterium]
MKRNIFTVIIGLFFIVLSITAAGAATQPTYNTFTQIGAGGFGDSANSYSWSVYWFKGNLYVGTNRHHLHSMYEAISYMPGLPFSIDFFPDYLKPDPPPSTNWFTPEWADAFQGEIWRYTKNRKWQKVHQSGTFTQQNGDVVMHMPVAYGYRALEEFDGYLYACGIGTWMPPVANNTILRSATGDPGTWEDVSGVIAGTQNIRAIAKWRDKLYVAASVSGKAIVFESAPQNQGWWKQVSTAGFGTPNNSEIYYLAVFNDHLYASTVNLVTGFEVWKTKGEDDDSNPGKYVWQRVIYNGFGDTWNQYGMTMAAFKDYLYVGTAVGIGMVMKKNAETGQDEVVGTRPLEIIRIDKNDKAQLIVGALKASDPITKDDGTSYPRVPLSRMGAGFNNPFNVYAWNMNVYDKCLYVGTLDLSVFVLGILRENPGFIASLLEMFGVDVPKEIETALDNSRLIPAVTNLLMKKYGGGDLWRSCNGVTWAAVTLNGFGNPHNYGIREVIPVKEAGKDTALAIGTANPFTGREKGGCEVWLKGKLPKKCF